jgi:hypothetical protein
MGRHYRRLGKLKTVTYGIVRTMGDIDDHPKPVHLMHDLASEGTETAPAVLSCARIANLVVGIVGQGHTCHAHAIEHTEHRQRTLDRSAVLHTYKYGSQAFRLILIDLGGVESELHLAFGRIYLVIEVGEHVEGIARRLVRGEPGRAIERKNGGVDSPGAKLREVDVAPGIILVEIARAHHL